MHEHGYNFYICMQVISIRMKYSNQKPFLNVHNWNKCIINIKCSNEGWSVISFAAMFQSCHLTLSTQPMAIWEGSWGGEGGGRTVHWWLDQKTMAKDLSATVHINITHCFLLLLTYHLGWGNHSWTVSIWNTYGRSSQITAFFLLGQVSQGLYQKSIFNKKTIVSCILHNPNGFVLV